MHIVSVDDVYRFVDLIQVVCKQKSAAELDMKFSNALKLRSSGLEILGAVRQTIIDNREQIECLIGPDRRNEIAGVITFVNKAYGR